MYAKRKRSSLSYSINENNSPESLSAVKDPYSSDDEKFRENVKKHHISNTASNDVKQVDTILFKKQKASSLKAEHVHYFLHVDFDAMVDEISLETASVENCLAVLFQFVTGKEADNILTNSDITYNNINMKDMKEFYLSKEDMKWLYQNDDLCYKTANVEEIDRKRQFLISCNNSLDFEFKDAQRYALSVCNLYSKLLTEQVKTNKKVESYWTDLNTQLHLTKSYLQTLALLLKYEDYKQSGHSFNWFPLRVHPDDVSEGSPLIEERLVQILTIPDGLFTLPIKLKSLKRLKPFSDNYTSKIVAEVYTSIDEGASHSTTYGQDFPYITKELRNDNDSCNFKPTQKCRIIAKPQKSVQDCISDVSYCADVRKWIMQSLPNQCCTTRIVDKMAGHHVMQLFHQAFHNKAISKLLGNDQEMCEEKSQEICEEKSQNSFGMFLVDEHIYFSRLHVDNYLLGLINGLEYSGSLTDSESLNVTLDSMYESIKPPFVAYSPFRLNITKPCHRNQRPSVMSTLTSQHISTLFYNNTAVRTKFLGPDKYNFTIDLPCEEAGDVLTVGHLATKIQELTGVPTKNQKLIFKGKSLTNETASLKELGLKSSSKIMLIGRKMNSEDENLIKKIVAIEKTVGTTEKKLSDVIYEMDGIHRGYLAKDKESESLNKLKKRILGVNEDFARQLEQLDSLSLTDSAADVKTRRKVLVSKIQTLLNRSDEIHSGLDEMIARITS